MRWNSFGEALDDVTRVPYRHSDVNLFFVKPGTPIYPIELCCARNGDMNLFDFHRQGKLPYLTWCPIEPHMSQRPVRTDVAWFIKSTQLFCAMRGPFAHHIDRTFGNRLAGQDWVIVMLEEFDIQKIGVDIIVGFMVSEHELYFLTDCEIMPRDSALGDYQQIKMLNVRNSHDTLRFDTRIWDRPEPIMWRDKAWFIDNS